MVALEILDKKHCEILLELQRHPLHSDAKIARKLGMNEKTVRRIIAELIENGVVRIKAVTTPWMVGFQTTALIGIRVDLTKVDYVMRSLAEMPRVHWVNLTTGRFDLIIWVTFPSPQHLGEFLKREIGLIDGIMSLETMLVTEFKKRDLGILVDHSGSRGVADRASLIGDRTRSEGSTTDPPSIDNCDCNIIRQLQDDARIKFAELSRKLQISESTVRRRIGRLINESVIKIAAVIDPFKVGYTTVGFIGISADVGKLTEIWPKLVGMPEIHVLFFTTGPFDMFAWVTFLSPQQLSDFVSNELYKVSGIVRTETFVNLEIYKREYGIL